MINIYRFAVCGKAASHRIPIRAMLVIFALVVSESLLAGEASALLKEQIPRMGVEYSCSGGGWHTLKLELKFHKDLGLVGSVLKDGIRKNTFMRPAQGGWDLKLVDDVRCRKVVARNQNNMSRLTFRLCSDGMDRVCTCASACLEQAVPRQSDRGGLNVPAVPFDGGSAVCSESSNGEACSGHGDCIYQAGVAKCACDRGFIGETCEHECPGWSEPGNRPQRVCSGSGSCQLHPDGGSAICVCDDRSQRYGEACQYQHASPPDL